MVLSLCDRLPASRPCLSVPRSGLAIPPVPVPLPSCRFALFIRSRCAGGLVATISDGVRPSRGRPGRTNRCAPARTARRGHRRCGPGPGWVGGAAEHGQSCLFGAERAPRPAGRPLHPPCVRASGERAYCDRHSFIACPLLLSQPAGSLDRDPQPPYNRQIHSLHNSKKSALHRA